MEKTLFAFDLDDTLFTHEENKLKIYIRYKDTDLLHEEISAENTKNYIIPENCYFDFSDFKSSSLFIKHAKPINRTIKLIKKLFKLNKNIEIITARTDLDDQKKFSDFLYNHGIDINKIHVRRVGNMNLNISTAAKKRIQIKTLIKDYKYTKVHLYDDSIENLSEFLKLIDDFPNVEFVAHQIKHDKKTGKTLKIKWKN